MPDGNIIDTHSGHSLLETEWVSLRDNSDMVNRRTRFALIQVK